jgi:hypothetical protein
MGGGVLPALWCLALTFSPLSRMLYAQSFDVADALQDLRGANREQSFHCFRVL